MVGRRVALLCIDPLEESLEDFHPFNYSVRRVQAGLVARGIETHIIESRSKDIEPFLARIAEVDPDIIGASAYVWSFPSFVEIARRVKERRPDTTIVFGGPSARAAMFELPPFREHRMHIDALVEGEAEDTFADIVTLASLTQRYSGHCSWRCCAHARRLSSRSASGFTRSQFIAFTLRT